jgi:glucokinase
MNTIIALDIGGTHMRAAVFAADSETPLTQKRIRTYSGGQSPLDRLVGLINEVRLENASLKAIGMAVPGPVDPRTGTIPVAPNIPELSGVPLKAALEEKTGGPVFLGNDANLAGVGEWRFGAGKGHHNLIYLTISTGIGGGVICDDHLLLGDRGLGAELGHVTIWPEGPLCSCGQKGHLEAVSSGTAIARFVAERLAAGDRSSLSGQPDAKTISQAAQAGDPLARTAFERAGKYLGLAVANYLQIFNPSIVIFGGGVSQTGDLLLAPVRETMRQSVLSKHYLEGLTLTQAELGDDAGLYGALALAQGLI